MGGHPQAAAAQHPSPAKWILGRLDNQAKLTLSRSPHAGATALFDDCVACAADKLMSEYGGPVWDESAFTTLHDKVRAELFDTAAEVVERVRGILAVWHSLGARLAEARPTPRWRTSASSSPTSSTPGSSPPPATRACPT
nr:hypothetical protein GCM10020093_043100 [Planobispora longispora]